jgi:hypothetical protein
VQGFAIGTLTAVNGLGTMIGPLAFGVIYARYVCAHTHTLSYPCRAESAV